MHLTLATNQTADPGTPWKRIGAIAVVTALAVVGLNALLVAWLRGPTPTADESEAAEQRLSRETVSLTPSQIPVLSKAFENATEDKPPRSTQDVSPDPRATKALRSPDPPALPIKRLEPAPEPGEKVTARFKAGDKFFQEVVVSRQSASRILGAEIGQNVRYSFVSSFTVDKLERDGRSVITQKVETARFGKGDPDLQALLADTLRQTEGAKFEMTVSPAGEITRFKGAQDPVKVFGDKNPLSGQTFLLWSFLDDDAWKELAQLTFLQPDKPLRKGTTWTRSLSHGWGPLGGWSGKTVYQAVGRQAGLELINYAHDMTYQPPRGAGGGLPFEVQKAEFKPQTAGGAILYDTGRSRVAAAEEAFRVRGVIVLTIAGAEASVEMDEAQLFRLRVLDEKPAAEHAR